MMKRKKKLVFVLFLPLLIIISVIVMIKGDGIADEDFTTLHQAIISGDEFKVKELMLSNGINLVTLYGEYRKKYPCSALGKTNSN